MAKTRIGFIGLGLIGGSIAKGLRRAAPDYEILAYSHTRKTLDLALEENVIDIACEKEDPLFGTCDYIFLCAPVQTNATYLPFLKKVMKDTCILTDVGSVKGIVHQEIRNAGLSDRFIGGHPMAGSEKTGLASATDYLMENAYYVITPEPEISEEKVNQFVNLVDSLGAIPLVLPPEQHDFVVAGISHLPHIVASQLVNTVSDLDTDDQLMKLVAAGGFKDITRIASSSPVMWQQICLTNGKQIGRVLDAFIERLQTAKELVEQGDSEQLMSMFQESKNYRDSLLDMVSNASSRQHVLYCDIRDEAGGIASITVLLAVKIINLKDIGIIHNREFEEGVLRIEFYNHADCERAEEILKRNNYTVHRRK